MLGGKEAFFPFPINSAEAACIHAIFLLLLFLAYLALNELLIGTHKYAETKVHFTTTTTTRAIQLR